MRDPRCRAAAGDGAGCTAGHGEAAVLGPVRKERELLLADGAGGNPVGGALGEGIIQGEAHVLDHRAAVSLGPGEIGGHQGLGIGEAALGHVFGRPASAFSFSFFSVSAITRWPVGPVLPKKDLTAEAITQWVMSASL
jgi:hypothetical protein